MQKIKHKLNSSVQLGKTLSRFKNHSLHQNHLSEPREFQPRSPSLLRVINPPQFLVPAGSTMKLSGNRGQAESLVRHTTIDESLIERSMRVARMYLEMHSFIVSIDQLRWIMNESYRLMEEFLGKSENYDRGSHPEDLANISRELIGLIRRFQHIDRGILREADHIQKLGQRQNEFCDLVEVIGIRHQNRRKMRSSKHLQEKRQKENIDNINKAVNISTHFENIKLGQSSTAKVRRQVQIEDRSMKKVKEEGQLIEKIRNEQLARQQLSCRNQMLRDQIQSLQNQLNKYRVVAFRSVQQLGQNLKRLGTNLNSDQKQFQLLKMLQNLADWQKMMQSDVDEAKFRQIYGNAERCDGQRMRRMEEIIGLQYEINNLMGLKKCLQQIERASNQRQQIIQDANLDIYRMLTVQACTIQELCKL